MICCANQMTGFFMKFNNGLKLINFRFFEENYNELTMLIDCKRVHYFQIFLLLLFIKWHNLQVKSNWSFSKLLKVTSATKAITSQNKPCEAQIKNFFVS